jgi:hypothetical protein
MVEKGQREHGFGMESGPPDSYEDRQPSHFFSLPADIGLFV